MFLYPHTPQLRSDFIRSKRKPLEDSEQGVSMTRKVPKATLAAVWKVNWLRTTVDIEGPVQGSSQGPRRKMTETQ